MPSQRPLQRRRPLRKSFAACLAASLFACAAAAVVCRAQGTTPKRGFAPAASYAVSDIESVNTTNGNLGLQIPIANLPAGRGGSPGAGLTLSYNSKIWDTPITILPDGTYDNYGVPQGSPQNYLKLNSEAGWRYGAGYEVRLINSLDEYSYSYFKPSCESNYGSPVRDAEQVYRVEVIFPDGSAHEFVPQNFQSASFTDGKGYYSIRPDGYLTYCSCTVLMVGGVACTRPTIQYTTGTMTYYSTDGSYIRLDVAHDSDANWSNNTWSMYLPDGTRVTGSAITGIGGSAQPGSPGLTRVYDRNDNYVDVSVTQNLITITDQFNRSIRVERGAEPFVDYVRATGYANEPMTWTVRWRVVHVRKKYRSSDPSGGGCPSTMMSCVVDMAWSFMTIDRIELPAQSGGLAYVFDYNGSREPIPQGGPPSVGWGELNSVTLPSGASALYAYRRDNESDISWEAVLQNHPVTKTLKYLRENDGSTAEATELWSYAFTFYTKTSTSLRTEVTAPDLGKTLDEMKLSSTTPPGFDNGLSYRTFHPDGTVVERIWAANMPHGHYWMLAGNPYVKTEFTSVRDAAGNLTKTSIKDYDYDKNGNLSRLSEYDWVPYGDVPRTNPGFGMMGVPTGVPPASLHKPKRVMLNTYYRPTQNASVANPANEPNSYSRFSSTRLRNALAATEVRDGSGATLSRSEFTYDNPETTGNLTLQRSWDSARAALPEPRPAGHFLEDSNSISVRREYDDNAPDPALRHGNLTLLVDARGGRTTYSYAPISGPGGASFPRLYPTTSVVAEGSAVARTTTNAYDFTSGLLTRVTDEDNQVSTVTDYDVFGRPTLIEDADGETDAGGVSVERQTRMEYSDALRRIITRTDIGSTGDGRRVTVRHFDQLGRERLSRTLEDAAAQSATEETAGVKIQNRYLVDPSTRLSYHLVSNPYRAAHSSDAGGEATMGWALTVSDPAGRVVRVETFAGAALPAPFSASPNAATTGRVETAYDGEFTTVTDQAGRVRRTRDDGLGRVVRVDEPSDSANTLGGLGSPTQPTAYAYDALSNLVLVRQGGQLQNGVYTGGQTRTFVYDSLSRLSSATNPENGKLDYEYDAQGNLRKRLDQRLLPGTATRVKTEYAYDELNRITARTYNDGTPDVTYTYDTGYTDENNQHHAVAHARGRLVQVRSSASTYTYTAFDALGRVRASSQRTNGVTYSMPAYEYDLAGGLTSQQYPSGRVVKTEYDAAGRVAGVKDSAASSFYAGGAAGDAANRFKYAAHGAVTSVRLGNGLWESVGFNARLQPVSLGVGTSAAAPTTHLDLSYTYGLDPAHNDGNVRTQTIKSPGVALPFVQTYAYDELNRLKSATETNGAASTWAQVYSYDKVGNRTLAAGTTFPAALNAANNPSVNPDDNRISSPGYAYDAAGNLLCDPSHPCAQSPAFTPFYTYDADNRLRAAGGGSSYAYDGDGRRVKKVRSGVATTVFVYDALGRLVAEYGDEPVPPQSTPTSYVTQDQLSSTRLVTGGDKEVKGRYDYHPFGEEVSAGRVGNGGPSTVRKKFATYERDEENGLDFAQNRYYSYTHGRFTSVDPALVSASTRNPQSWNRYAYALNNPELYIDPLGLWALIFKPVYKKKDGKDTTEISHYVVIAIKTKDSDNAERLAEQLGLRGKDADKFAKKVAESGQTTEVELAKSGGEVGRIFKTVQDLYTLQKKYEAEHGVSDKGPNRGIYFGMYGDCSTTSANLFSTSSGANVNSWGVVQTDEYIERNLASKPASDLQVGDIVRYGLDEVNKKGEVTRSNVPKHFTTFLLMSDDGVPMVFSRSGDGGAFGYGAAKDFEASNYGPVRGRKNDATGFYGKRK
jgi:RHS repeat-associated protein